MAVDRLYLRPSGFIDSPQLHEGRVRRLAGSMLWFSQVEILRLGANGRFDANLVSLDDWGGIITTLDDDEHERAEALMTNLLCDRAPMTLGERVLRFDQPHVMGIVNMTPDSFSDGGKHGDVDAGVAAAFAMSEAGASIVDIGGESTRPGAKLVWEGEEIERTKPLIERLATAGIALSIDTRKAAVMEAAIGAGAHMVNDISGLLYDEEAIGLVARANVPVCIMHASSQSSDPHKNPHYQNVVADVFDWLEERVLALEAAGIGRERIIVDPGLGFGKSLADNVALMNNLSIFHGLGCPLLVGVSRKRMIGALAGEAAADERLGGSLMLAVQAVQQGAHIVRVHDVPETVQAIRVWRGLRDGALTVLA